MDADWSIEAGADDAVLEFPWSAPDKALTYVDLKSCPERVDEVAEAQGSPEMREALLALNASDGLWLTAKCDVWVERELSEAEAIYGGEMKFASYIDLIVATVERRFSFEWHEQRVKHLAQELARAAEANAAAEFIVRRCWYRTQSEGGHEPGFYLTFYLFGYGRAEAEARASWSKGLKSAISVLSKNAVG